MVSKPISEYNFFGDISEVSPNLEFGDEAHCALLTDCASDYLTIIWINSTCEN